MEIFVVPLFEEPHLHFQRRDSHFDIEDDSVCEAAHRGFVDRVNLILALPGVGDTIDDFNLTFWLSSLQTYWSDHLPRWIGFALQKRVKRLTINLQYLDSYSNLKDLKNSFTLDNKLISSNHNIDSLVSLCLCKVDVTGQFLEHLLTICGSLEHLSISYSTALVDFTVSGLCLKLKYLKIHYCLKLRRLRIRHVNLVSLEYDPALDANHAAVVIEDVPHLRLSFFKGKDKTAKVLTHLPHLQTLGLTFHDNRFLGPSLVFPKLMNLVKVELELIDEVFSSTICASLLVSCPSIRQLVLKFLYLVDLGIAENNVERLKHPHECLKVLELVGFIGCKLDTGVALYIIENTLSLEKIVVDTSHPYRSMETRSIDEQVEDEISQIETKLSESEMREFVDSISRARADQYEFDMRERVRARAHAREHLASRLSLTRTQLVVK